MTNCLVQRLANGATALTDDRLSAAQLETYLTRQSVPAALPVWQSARIRSRAAWLEELWTTLGEEPLLLSVAQARALWVRTIADAGDDATVLHTNVLAAAAQDAWRLLLQWDLDPGAQRARPGESAFATFLSWAELYRARLRAAEWIDGPLVTGWIAAAVERGRLDLGELVVADLREAYPAVERLLTSFEEAGGNLARWQPDDVSRRVETVGLDDRREEIDAALTWACERLHARPAERIALVIPPERGIEAQVRRWFAGDSASAEGEGSAHPVVFVDGASAAQQPLLGAALDCLRLLGRSSNFLTLSRVLRCAFLAEDDGERGRRAILETALRGSFAAQSDFPAAFRYGGLAAEFRAAVPELAERLAGILEQLGELPHVQSATRWASFMDEALRRLGWQGAGEDAPDEAAALWARATNDFCTMSPIVGGLTYERAVGELDAALHRLQQPIELPMAGVTIFSSLDQVGPGYDAAWSLGMSDRAWPSSPRLNRLLPLGLQRSQGMPFATPEAALDRCRRATTAFIARVPDVVFSYPRIVDEEPAAPSALIRDFAPVGKATAQRRCARAEHNACSQSDALETIDDPVPPMTDPVLPGGARTLALQAQCPLRAYIESRLAARPLDRPERGIGPRLRGVLAHRALELTYTALDSKAAMLEVVQRGELRDLVASCTERALRGALHAVGPSQRALLELERARLEALVTTVVHSDIERDDFTIDALEVRQEVQVGGVRIRCRIDRVDSLADGRVAIIDYKTGRTVSARGLLAARLAEPQLPLYALTADTGLGGLVYAAVSPNAVVYRGLWEPADLFPGRPSKLPADRDWHAQRALWQEQIGTLVAELVGGDGRIFADAVETMRDEFATLSRACEIETMSADAMAEDDT